MAVGEGVRWLSRRCADGDSLPVHHPTRSCTQCPQGPRVPAECCAQVAHIHVRTVTDALCGCADRWVATLVGVTLRMHRTAPLCSQPLPSLLAAPPGEPDVLTSI